MASSKQIINTTVPLNTTVPILTGDAATTNNQAFAVTGSSSGGGGDYFNVFSTGGSAFWVPTGTANEFITVTFPYQCLNRGFLYQCRGATSANYHSGCQVQGSNDNTNWTTLASIPDNLMQNTNVNTISFANQNVYKYYRFFITSTVGTVTGLGFFNMQYAGYVLF